MWPRVERLLSQEDADALCAYWQAVLRIQDWDIEVKIVRRPEFTTQNVDCGGECNTWQLRRRAVIYLLHPEDYALFAKNSKFVAPQDMEVTLVHELLHVALNPVTLTTVKEGTPEATAEEQFIDTLSRALVHLYRRTEPATVAPNQPGVLPQLPLLPMLLAGSPQPGSSIQPPGTKLTLRVSNEDPAPIPPLQIPESE